MAVRDEKVIDVAKALTNEKAIDEQTYSIIWETYLKPYLKTKMPGAFNTITSRHTVTPYQKISYISSRFKPLVRVYSESGDWMLLDTGGVVLVLDADLYKPVTLTIVWGTDDALECVEAICGRMLAEAVLQTSKNAFGIESVSNSFDVSTLTTKFKWTEWTEYQEMLKRFWVSDKKEVGCLI